MNQDVRNYMAAIGSKGGKRSKRKITPEQQRQLIAARKRKLRLRKRLMNLIRIGDWRSISNMPGNHGVIAGILLACIQKSVFNSNYFTALQEITGENPASDKLGTKIKESDLPTVASAWIEWGIQKKLIRRL